MASAIARDLARRWLAPSFRGRLWHLREGLPRRTLLETVLRRRNIGPSEEAFFLAPSLKDQTPNPRTLSDMTRAAERTVGAIRNREPIVLFGDYDVDGAASCAILLRLLEEIGAAASFCIPDRLKEGYGPGAQTLKRLASEGAKLLICLDSGTNAHEALAAARDAGLDVVVLDHHAIEGGLPPAFAVVNPHRPEDAGKDLGMLSTAGLALLLACEIKNQLSAEGLLAGCREPELTPLTALAALGTICDLVPLTGPNRAFASRGLQIMSRLDNPGIAALARIAGAKPPFSEHTAGFVLGPRINAAGRIGDASLGTRLLTTGDAARAQEIAQKLEACNTERKAMSDKAAEEAIALAESGRGDAACVAAAARNWHPGIAGIAAARLREHFDKPAFAFALGGGLATGSGRSMPGFDLGAAIAAAKKAGLVLRGGGHPMACGAVIEEEKLEAFTAFMDAAARAAGIEQTYLLDAVLPPGAATPEDIAGLRLLAPFGTGNPEPRFAIAGGRIAEATPLQGRHLRLTLEGPDGRGIKVIAFGVLPFPFGRKLLASIGAAVDAAGRLATNTWKGRTSIELVLEDAIKPSS